MIEIIIFCFEQYSLLFFLFMSALGWGRLFAAKLLTGDEVPRLSGVVLQATAGLGLITLLCIFVATIGALTVTPLLAIAVTGIVLFIPQLIEIVTRHNLNLDVLKVGSLGAILSILVILAAASFLSNSLVRPLRLPMEWDELMYHLPTAQAWAESGRLLVTDWLRYPLFPFNMEVLYAGAIVLGDDVTPHLVHAFTGFLTVALTFSVARMFVPTAFSILAAICLLHAIRLPVQTADIDLGLMLYVFSAFVTLAFCFMENRRGLCLLAAFFIGLALGTKYQAMFFLPAFSFCFLMIERNWKILALAVLITLLTGFYWYARNYLISGDPIHPLGGPVFGYWHWSADDIERQFANLQTVQKFPPWYLLPSVGSFIFWRSATSVLKGCMCASLITVLIWYIVSGYDRYLMPAYPMLAILSSYFLHRLFAYVSGYEIAEKLWERLGKVSQVTITTMILLAVIIDWGKSTVQDIKELVLPDSMERVNLQKQLYPGYELLSALDRPLIGTVYQLGFEGELYYLGTPVLGDHFGASRYKDVQKLLGQPKKLATHLRSLGAEYFLINLVNRSALLNKATSNPHYSEYFELVKKTHRAALYRIREVEKSTASSVMRYISEAA